MTNQPLLITPDVSKLPSDDPMLDYVDAINRTIIAAYTLLTGAVGKYHAKSLDDAERILGEAFGGDAGWKVYRGGDHVALIRKWGDEYQTERVLLVTEIE